MIDLSIIIINFNSNKYITECINSCLNQKTKFNYEILVIDDESSDKSIYIINKFKLKKNLKIFANKKNLGIEKSSNIGFKKAKGKFVCRVDSDDKISQNFVETSLRSFKKGYSFVFPNYKIISSSGKIIGYKKLPVFDKLEILKRGDFLATGTVYRKSTLQSINFYNIKFKNCGLENFELILNLILIKKKKGYHINKFLFYLRKHAKNLSKIKQNSILNYGKIFFKRMKFGTYSVNLNNPNF